MLKFIGWTSLTMFLWLFDEDSNLHSEYDVKVGAGIHVMYEIWFPTSEYIIIFTAYVSVYEMPNHFQAKLYLFALLYFNQIRCIAFLTFIKITWWRIFYTDAVFNILSTGGIHTNVSTGIPHQLSRESHRDVGSFTSGSSGLL